VAILDGLKDEPDPMRQWRLTRLHGWDGLSWDALVASSEWRQASEALTRHGGENFKLS
jgi:hypothetical protein